MTHTFLPLNSLWVLHVHVFLSSTMCPRSYFATCVRFILSCAVPPCAVLCIYHVLVRFFVTPQELCEGLPERSLFAFNLNNPIRKLCIYVIRSWYFDQFILGIIFLNCIFLAMQTREPGFDQSARGRVVHTAEYIFTSIFLAELVVKVIAMGFMRHPGSYLRDGWNVLDFIVVVLGVLAFFNFGNYTGIRTVRVLRPLRTITGVEGMRIIVSTLLTSLPMLLDVLILCMFLLVIFGIVGVQFFANKLEKRCYTPVWAPGTGWPALPQSWEIDDEQKDIVCKGPSYPSIEKSDSGRTCPSGMWCQYYNNPNYNITSFDNILYAWLTIFQCISLEGWTDVMYDLMDGFGDSVVIYFVVLIVFGSFFAVNLALAVLTLHFTETATGEREEEEEDFSMMNEPSDKLAAGATAADGLPPPRTSRCSTMEKEADFRKDMADRARHSNSKLVDFCYNVQRALWFEYLTMGLILLNTIIMSLEYDGMHGTMEEAFEYANYVLTFYFFVEMIIKMIGLGLVGYSHDRMNVFDGVVVLCSIIEIAVERAVGGNAASGLSVLRSFRLLRVFKLARSWKQLNKIIKAIFKSLASIAYLSLILLLVIFIFALMGMQFFGYQFAFCDYVDDAKAICPPYDETCPNNRDCYISCLPEQNGKWIVAEGSKFNDQALCLSYPPPGFEFLLARPDGQMAPYTYLAKVGTSDVSRHNFNNIYWSTVTIFQILTGENWNTVMYDAMRSVGDIASIYFILLVVIGNYIILNLFLAILLDKFGEDDEDEDEDMLEDDDSKIVNGTDAKQGKGATSTVQYRDWSNVIKDMHTESTFNVTKLRKDTKTSGNGSPGPQSPRSNTPNSGNLQGDDAQPASKDGDKKSASPTKNGADVSIDTTTKSASTEVPASTHAGDAARKARKKKKKSTNEDDTADVPKAVPFDRPQIDLSHVEGSSLGIFAPDNKIRVYLASIVNNPRFEQAIIGLIIVSSVVLALDEPRISDASTLKKVLNILDFIFVYCFLIECIIKVIVLGFIFNKGSYLRNRWNMMDFVIVIVGLFTVHSPGGGQVGALRALRTLRALRPIRMASRAQGMKVVVNALFQAIPGCGNVALVCMLFYLIFGILGVNLLKGMFFYCEGCVCEYDPTNTTNPYGPCDLENCSRLEPDMVIRNNALAEKSSAMTEFWCNTRYHVVDFAYSAGYFQRDVNLGPPTTPGFVSANMTTASLDANYGKPYALLTTWKNRETNFDNIGHALLALFEMATLEMWLDVMYDGMDATEKHFQPLENSQPYIGIFFIMFIIVGGLFVLNLFVGVTIDKFNEMREEQDGSSVFMTKEQENWKRIQKLLMNVKPRQTTKAPTNKRLAAIHAVVSREDFDVFIMGMILLNAAFLSMHHADMSDEWKLALNIANYFFTSVFTIEASLKLLAFSVRGYFMDSWNVFDFFTVVVSWIGIILDAVSGSQVPAVSVFRVFRVARVFRLIPKAKGLQTLFHTLTFSLPALVNVGSVFALFLFIYAVMGMNLFGLVKHGENLTSKANFGTFPKAMLLLFRMATGESWNGIMHDCMITNMCTRVVNPLRTDPQTGESMYLRYFNRDDPRLFYFGDDEIEDGCSPHPVVAIIYFISFVILCAFVMLNLVVGVILDNFQDTNTIEAMPVSREHLERFANVWGQLDPRGTYYVSASKLSHIISQVDPPLGVRGTKNDKASTQAIVLCIDVPEHDGRIHFLETLHALAGRVAGTDLPEREMKKIRDTAQEKLPSLKEDFVPRYSASHYNAALYVQAAVRGFLARQEIKERRHPFEINNDTPTTATSGSDSGGGGGGGGSNASERYLKSAPS